MRYVVLSLLVVPAIAGAQTRQGPAEAVPASSDGVFAPLASAQDIPDDQAKPLARSTVDARIISKNEAYNRARVAEGRVGVRLGNDESYRITGN